MHGYRTHYHMPYIYNIHMIQLNLTDHLFCFVEREKEKTVIYVVVVKYFQACQLTRMKCIAPTVAMRIPY